MVSAVLLVISLSCSILWPAVQPKSATYENCTPATNVIQPASPAAMGYPLTVTDDLDRQVTIHHLPQRIVSLAPSNTEILFALGLDDRIVGVTDYCDYPTTASTKAKVAGFSTPNMEKLVSLQPDLIVGTAIHEKTVLPALEKLGYTVYIATGQSIDAIENDISVLGKITGSTARAEDVLSRMNAKIKSVTDRTKNLTDAQKPRVLYVYWYDPLWSMGAACFINDVIEQAGGINVFENDFEKAKSVSLESVLSKNPQVVIVSGMGTSGDAVFKAIKSERRLSPTEAWSNNRIYKISDAALIERPGPRIANGLIELAVTIHPELFGVK